MNHFDINNMKTPSRRPLSIALSLSIALAPLLQVNPVMAGGAATTVAPNLMVIFGNSYSMNRMMDNINLPLANGKEIQNQCPANYNSPSDFYPAPSFDNDPGCGYMGTPFPDHLYGNQKDSKLYIAKDVLNQLMQSPKSNSINFGFATFRQAFGMQNSVSTVLTNTFWPNIFPSGGYFGNPLPGSLSGYTTDELNTYGQDENNFSWVSWWPAYDTIIGASFAIGLKKKNGAAQPDNSQVASFLKTASGLPLSVQYKRGQQSPYYERNLKDGGNYYYGSGGLDIGSPINAVPGSVDPKFTLCKTYYNSQENSWQGEYIASNSDSTPRMVVNTYPGTYNGSTIQFIPIGATQYNADGSMAPQQWTDYCGVTSNTRTIRQQSEMISDQLSGSPAYFNYIPNIYDNTGGSQVGAFTGWSGSASYDPATNTYTASYPAKAQPSTGMGSYNKSGAPTMGAFIDLPSPSAGYIDQRKMVQNLVNPAYPQWDDSGLGYDQNSQTITNEEIQQSISASDYKPDYAPHQEPVYDSLMDAAAYFSAYKKQDAFDICRTNAVLLIYDGHEDANYTKDEQGNLTYADPSKAAAALLALGVKTNVVIISNNPGDIAQANAIAAAGGTKQAFQVNNANDLLNAVGTVFTGLQGAVVSGSPAVPGQVSYGSMVYASVSSNAYGSMEGHLNAYSIQTDGSTNTTPAFDAASPSIQANRISKLWSNNAGQNGSQTLTAWSSLPSSVFAAQGTPDAATISAYTVDPNSSNGAYLAGRRSGSIVGTITSQSSHPVFVDHPNNPSLLNATGYPAYAQSAASRAPFVLWAADDGFLYSSDAKTGALNWAYMPSPLLPLLKNYATFEASKPMAGGFGVYDGVGSDGAWHSFVYGSAQSGATHYGFQLNSSGQPDGSVPVLIDNQSGSTSTDNVPAVAWDSNGVAYAIYTTVNGTTANINVMSSTGSVTMASLSFIPSSPIALNQSTGSLYIGATNGKVYGLNTNSGFSASAIASSYNASSSVVGVMTDTTDPAKYVGFAQTSTGIYVWATGDKQIAVFTVGANGWMTNWSTRDGGSSMNLVNGTSKTYTSDPGVNGTGPQFLPAKGVITDKSVVTNGTLIVPVTTTPEGSIDACTVSGAYYYLYRLNDGTFPMGQFTGPDGKDITNNIVLGSGIAFSPVVAYNATLGGLSIYGASQQDISGLANLGLKAKSRSSVPAGIVGLRPLMMTHP